MHRLINITPSLVASETGQGNAELLRFAPDSPWTLFYDMEALFPDKRADAPPPREEPVSVQP